MNKCFQNINFKIFKQNLKVGATIKDIRLFDGQLIDCLVEQRNNKLDCVWLRPTKDIDFAKDLRIEAPFASQEAIILGLSGVHQIGDLSSFDICNVACACVDDNGHFKTNKKSAPGESGAPIFDFYTGSLLGMMTGSEAYGCLYKTGCNQSMPNIQPKINEVKSQHINKELLGALFDKANAAGYGGKGCFVSSLYLNRDLYIEE